MHYTEPVTITFLYYASNTHYYVRLWWSKHHHRKRIDTPTYSRARVSLLICSKATSAGRHLLSHVVIGVNRILLLVLTAFKNIQHHCAILQTMCQQQVFLL